jgi:hypothetical protein
MSQSTHVPDVSSGVAWLTPEQTVPVDNPYPLPGHDPCRALGTQVRDSAAFSRGASWSPTPGRCSTRGCIPTSRRSSTRRAEPFGSRLRSTSSCGWRSPTTGGPTRVAHWYDVALIALPMLRPLRLLALARILNRSVASSRVGRFGTYVFGASVMAAFLGALAMLDAQQTPAGRTSRHTVMRCGGRLQPSRRWATGTGTRRRRRAGSSVSRS